MKMEFFRLSVLLLFTLRVSGQFRRASSSKLGSNEYWLFRDRKTWPEAVLQCEKEGMEIAEVRTPAEAMRIAQLMMKNRPDAIESAWIGGYAKNKTGGIVWRWISTNEEINNNISWKSSKNSMKNPSTKGCLLFDWHHREEPGFIESPCDMKREYICQKFMNNTSMKNSVDNIRFFMSISSTTTEKMTPTMSTGSTKATTSVSKKLITETTVDLLKENELSTTTMATTETDREYEEFYDYGATESILMNNATTKVVAIEQKKVTIPAETMDLEQKSTTVVTPSRPQFTTEMKVRTTPRPIVEQRSKFYDNPRPKNQVKFVNNLKLYYAFEGPLVGGIYSTNSRSNSGGVRKYKKYIPIKKKLVNEYKRDYEQPQ